MQLQVCSLLPFKCRCLKNNYKRINLCVNQQQKGACTCSRGSRAGRPKHTQQTAFQLSHLLIIYLYLPVPRITICGLKSPSWCWEAAGSRSPGTLWTCWDGSGSQRGLPLVERAGASAQLVAPGVRGAAAALTPACAATRAFTRTQSARELWKRL